MPERRSRFEGDIGQAQNLSRSDFWNQTSVIRKDGYGARNDDDTYYDYTPRDILGTGKYYGKGPRGYTRSSEKIEEEICEHLTAHPEIDASHIEIEVIGDEVHLKGEVLEREAKWLVEDLAVHTLGVKTVINQLRVRS